MIRVIATACVLILILQIQYILPNATIVAYHEVY